MRGTIAASRKLKARSDPVRNRPLSTSGTHQNKTNANGNVGNDQRHALKVSIKSSNTHTQLQENHKVSSLEVHCTPQRSRTCENCSHWNNKPMEPHLFSDRLHLSNLVDSVSVTKDPLLCENLAASNLIRNSSCYENLASPANDRIYLTCSDCKLSEQALDVSSNFIKESKSQAEWRKRFAAIKRTYYQKSAALIFAGICIFSVGTVLSILYLPRHSRGVQIFGPLLLAAGLLTVVCGIVWIPIITGRMRRKKQVLTKTFSM